MSEDSIEEIERLMQHGDSASIEKIMDKFVIIDKNLILKTDIENARYFTILLTMCDHLKEMGLMKSYKTLHDFCVWYIKVRVSHKRLSRKEILDAISAIKREASANSLTAKFLGLGGNKEK